MPIPEYFYNPPVFKKTDKTITMNRKELINLFIEQRKDIYKIDYRPFGFRNNVIKIPNVTYYVEVPSDIIEEAEHIIPFKCD